MTDTINRIPNTLEQRRSHSRIPEQGDDYYLDTADLGLIDGDLTVSNASFVTVDSSTDEVVLVDLDARAGPSALSPPASGSAGVWYDVDTESAVVGSDPGGTSFKLGTVDVDEGTASAGSEKPAYDVSAVSTEDVNSIRYPGTDDDLETILSEARALAQLVESEYDVSSVVSIPSQTALRGLGSGTTLNLPDGENSQILTANGEDDVWIDGLKIDASTSSTESNDSAIFFQSGCTGARVTNTHIIGPRRHAINPDNSSDGIFYGNVLEGYRDDGIAVGPNSNNNITALTIAKNSTGPGSNSGAEIDDGSDYNSISGVIGYSLSGPAFSVHNHPGTDGPVGWSVSSVIGHDNIYGGRVVDQDGNNPPRKGTISDVVSINSESNGLRLDGCEDVTVSDYIISNAGTDSDLGNRDRTGLVVQESTSSASDITLQNVTVTDSFRGIDIASAGDSTTLINVTGRGNSGGDLFVNAEGVEFWGCDFGSVTDNATRTYWNGVIGGGPLGGVDVGSVTGASEGDQARSDGTTGDADGLYIMTAGGDWQAVHDPTTTITPS